MRLGAMALLVAVLLASPCLEAADRTLAVDVGGKHLEGLPLFANQQQVALLGRDGALYQFPPKDGSNPKQTEGFKPYGISDFRTQLFREFGNKFDVTGTGHFLVVHPSGERDQWAERFESVYRAFNQYFTARGYSVRQPQFPLVAVVFPKREDFARHAKSQGLHASAQLLGFYAQTTNRIIMYDAAATSRDPNLWSQNADTVIHEVTHQVAFNCGVHARFADTPRWAVEGLGTLFEAPGVWNAHANPALAQRINRGRLRDFKEYLTARRRPGQIAEMIQSDRAFDTKPLDAYAEAWALTFYLSETKPREYARYMQKLAALQPFVAYPGPQRLKDFTDTFGPNLSLLEASYLTYLRDLK